MRASLILLLVLFTFASSARTEDVSDRPALPDMGRAPDFTLFSQDGEEVGLSSLRGKVVVIAFIYTRCRDICPILTDKMARVREELGAAFGHDVVFVSISLDPERDTPEVLKDYAEAFDANPGSWFFLTGSVAEVRQLTQQYGVVTLPGVDDTIGHNLLTTLVDRNGKMRVQYAGYRLDPYEMHRDLLALMAGQ